MNPLRKPVRKNYPPKPEKEKYSPKPEKKGFPQKQKRIILQSLRG